MKKRRLIFGAVATLLFTSTIAYASTPDIPTTQDLFNSSGLNKQSIVDQFPINNYAFDSANWKAQLNPMYHLANGVFFLAIFLLRMAITIMNFGFHPPELASLISAILGVTSQAVTISYSAFGLVGIVMVVMLVIDFGKGRPNVAIARLIKVAVVLGVIVAYSHITVDQVTTITKATDSVSSSLADAILSVPVNKDKSAIVSISKDDHNLSALAQTTMDMDDQIWANMAIYPFVMGEMGGNLQVGSKHLSEAREAPTQQLLIPSSNPYWYQALLQLPVDNDKRNDMRDALTSGDYSGVVSSFSWTNRLLIAFVTFLASFGPILFMALFGGLSFLLRLSFIFSLLAAIAVLILELIPTTRTNRYFMWWIKFSSGSLVGSVALATYVGMVSIALHITQSLSISLGAVFTILINGAWYIAAIWIFFKLVKKYNPVSVFNQFVDQKMPKQMRIQPHRGSEAASFDMTRNAGGKGGKSILSPNLLRGLNKKKQGTTNSQSKRGSQRNIQGKSIGGTDPFHFGNGGGSPLPPYNGGSGGGASAPSSGNPVGSIRRVNPFGVIRGSGGSSQNQNQSSGHSTPLTSNGRNTASSSGVRRNMFQVVSGAGSQSQRGSSAASQPPSPTRGITGWIDQKAEARWNQTKDSANVAYTTTKEAIQQAPNRLKQLPGQVGRSAVNAVRTMNPRDIIQYARRSWQEAKAYEKDQHKLRHSVNLDEDKANGPSTLLGKAIAYTKADFNDIKNTPDAHAFTRYALGAAETVTKGTAKALGTTAVRAGSAAVRTTAKTGLKTAGIAGAAAWVGMRKGQRFAEQKSMEVAVKSQVKLHEMSRQQQITKEAKQFIKGIDDWDMVAFHGKSHTSTVNPGTHSEPERKSADQAELPQLELTKGNDIPSLQPNMPVANEPTAPVNHEPNRPLLQRKPKPDIQDVKKSGTLNFNVTMPVQRMSKDGNGTEQQEGTIKEQLDSIAPKIPDHSEKMSVKLESHEAPNVPPIQMMPETVQHTGNVLKVRKQPETHSGQSDFHVPEQLTKTPKNFVSSTVKQVSEQGKPERRNTDTMFHSKQKVMNRKRTTIDKSANTERVQNKTIPRITRKKK